MKKQYYYIIGAVVVVGGFLAYRHFTKKKEQVIQAADGVKEPETVEEFEARLATLWANRTAETIKEFSRLATKLREMGWLYNPTTGKATKKVVVTQPAPTSSGGGTSSSGVGLTMG